MNCEHETLVGDNDLFQFLVIEYYYIESADIPVSAIHLLYAHIREYLPLMSYNYATQTINFLLGEIKKMEVEHQTFGKTNFNYENNIDLWNRFKNFLKTEKDKRLNEKAE